MNRLAACTIVRALLVGDVRRSSRQGNDSPTFNYRGPFIHALQKLVLDKSGLNYVGTEGVLVSLSGDSEPEIVDLADAIMTDRARWEALTGMHAAKIMSDRDYLQEIEPNMLGHMQRYTLDPQSRIAEVRGIDASPGQVLGRVAFRGFDPNEFGDLPPVLIIGEVTPDDIHDVDSSSAVVSSLGGKSSHAAVICRGMAKPCVAGCIALIVNDRERVAMLPDGVTVHERTPVLVNGTTGLVEFSDTGSLIPVFVTSASGPVLNHLTAVLRRITVLDRFRQLSVADQTHIAALKYRLTELRVAL